MELFEQMSRLHLGAWIAALADNQTRKIGVLAQGETVLDLGVGKVWVVRIEEIDRSPSTQRRSQVNRLLWDVGVG